LAVVICKYFVSQSILRKQILFVSTSSDRGWVEAHKKIISLEKFIDFLNS